jgi:hypothetical protein
MKNLLFVILSSTIFILGCKKNPTSQISNPGKEGLTIQQDSMFSLLKDTVISAKDMLLPDGGSVKDFLQYYDSIFYRQWNSPVSITTDIEVQKELFISKISEIARYMIIKTNYIYPSEGVMSPAQTGLAYVWGGRSFEQRKLNENCDDLLHGVDCSGMLIRIFRYAGLNISDSKAATTLKDVNYLNGLFSQNSNYNNLTYEDKGSSIALTQLQTGD